MSLQSLKQNQKRFCIHRPLCDKATKNFQHWRNAHSFVLREVFHAALILSGAYSFRLYACFTYFISRSKPVEVHFSITFAWTNHYLTISWKATQKFTTIWFQNRNCPRNGVLQSMFKDGLKCAFPEKDGFLMRYDILFLCWDDWWSPLMTTFLLKKLLMRTLHSKSALYLQILKTRLSNHYTIIEQQCSRLFSCDNTFAVKRRL